MFNCELNLTVVRKDGEATLTRSITLPFVPIVDMNLELSESEFDEFTPEYVEFNCHRHLFVLYEHSPADGIVDECDCLPEDDCDFCSLRATIADLRNRGWTVHHERRGYERLSIPVKGTVEPEKNYAAKVRLGL